MGQTIGGGGGAILGALALGYAAASGGKDKKETSKRNGGRSTGSGSDDPPPSGGGGGGVASAGPGAGRAAMSGGFRSYAPESVQRASAAHDRISQHFRPPGADQAARQEAVRANVSRLWSEAAAKVSVRDPKPLIPAPAPRLEPQQQQE